MKEYTLSVGVNRSVIWSPSLEIIIDNNYKRLDVIGIIIPRVNIPRVNNEYTLNLRSESELEFRWGV